MAASKVKAVLRSLGVYVFLVMICVFYALMPMTQREIARERLHHATKAAIEWSTKNLCRIDQ